MNIDNEKKCPGCNGPLIFGYGLALGGEPGYYELCGAEEDCGYYHKPNSEGDVHQSCFTYNKEDI